MPRPLPPNTLLFPVCCSLSSSHSMPCRAPHSDFLTVVTWTTAARNFQIRIVTRRVRRTASLLESTVVRLTEGVMLCSCLLRHRAVWYLDGNSLFIRNTGRLQLKCDGIRERTGGEAKGELANGVGSQYPSRYLGTWCFQHYYQQ
jgi:hypothetical protein